MSAFVAVGIFFFLLLLKIKANLRGTRGSGQYRIGVWEQRGHRPPCDILFPQVITTSLHSFSSLDFLSGSSHHALLSAFNSFFFPTWLGRRRTGALCARLSLLLCHMELEDGGWVRRRTSPGVNPEHGTGSGHHQSVGPRRKGDSSCFVCCWHHVFPGRDSSW